MVRITGPPCEGIEPVAARLEELSLDNATVAVLAVKNGIGNDVHRLLRHIAIRFAVHRGLWSNIPVHPNVPFSSVRRRHNLQIHRHLRTLMRIEAQYRISRRSIGAPNDDILQVNPQLHGPCPIWTDLIQHGLRDIVQVSTRNATSFSPGVQQTEPSAGLLPLPAPEESEKPNAAVIQLASVKAIEDKLPLAGGSHWFHQSMPGGFWHLPRCRSSAFGQSPGFPPSSSL
mmetsp:Transcript_32409/g.52272  ORF Transcript_32409/g.52272 Transcript_32409/m.52272 type:complete len:229 (-) Transcript_32409:374-1060(-)